MGFCFSSEGGEAVAFKIGALELVSFPAVVTVTVVAATVVLFPSKEATPALKTIAVHYFNIINLLQHGSEL